MILDILSLSLELTFFGITKKKRGSDGLIRSTCLLGFIMAKYCITAIRRDNPDNDCASRFKLFEYVEKGDRWFWSIVNRRGVSIYYIADLLSDGHEVLSAEEIESGSNTRIKTGVAVELELRIVDNDERYKISQMPDF